MRKLVWALSLGLFFITFVAAPGGRKPGCSPSPAPKPDGGTGGPAPAPQS